MQYLPFDELSFMIDDFTLPKGDVKKESFFKVLMAQIINSDLLGMYFLYFG